MWSAQTIMTGQKVTKQENILACDDDFEMFVLDCV